MNRIGSAVTLGCLVGWLVACDGDPDVATQRPAASHRVTGHAVLPAATFVEGPTSGQFIDGANGVDVPFDGRQPIQGFSAILAHPEGGFLVMSDNGYGARDNSADFVIRVTHIAPDVRMSSEGTGKIEVRSSVVLADPDSVLGIPLVAEAHAYPNGEGNVPVAEWIAETRALTGADLDPESFRQAPDGTLWLGDEFGPFLVHADISGRILGPVVGLPGVFAPENPLRGDLAANAKSSGGFEGMAQSPDGRTLYPLLEKPLEGEEAGVLNIYEFDTGTGAYAGDGPVRRYRLESPEHRIGAFTGLSEQAFLIVERDRKEGHEAVFKKIFLVDFDAADTAGILEKMELVDLLRIPDPDGVASPAAYFSFPFETIEGVVLIDDHTIGVINDNNYPFSVGRHVESGLPDDDELVLIRFDSPLTEMRIAKSPE